MSTTLHARWRDEAQDAGTQRPVRMGPAPRPLADRLWSQVDRSGDCWLWRGRLDSSGCGVMRVGSMADGTRTMRQCRGVAWELSHGPVPTGMRVRYRCDSPACVNPDHLFLADGPPSRAEPMPACAHCGAPVKRRHNRFCGHVCAGVVTTPKGTVRGGRRRWPPLEERFWSKVDRRGVDECWPWLGGRSSAGYGAFKFKGRQEVATRVMWQFVRGPIPAGLWVLHRCDNPPCCNPDHLFLGTNADNVADKIAKGRDARGDRSFSRLHPERLARGDKNGSRVHPESRPRGEAHASSKATNALVQEIRARYAAGGIGTRKLAADYNLGRSAIRAIVRGETWRHVTDESGGAP